MKLAVSNIAWLPEEESEIVALLKTLGVENIELAPTKNWQEPLDAPTGEVRAYKNFWHDNMLNPVAFQSMLFNHPEMQLFGTFQERDLVASYIKKFISFAAEFGVGVMVFGSPKNRLLKGRSPEHATEIAVRLFRELGEAAAKQGVKICFEPNAKEYGCEFVTDAKQGIEFVGAVNSSGVALHLDTACMELAGDDPAVSINGAALILSHFHISAPYLGEVGKQSNASWHTKAAKALKDSNYTNCISIEMRPGVRGENARRVSKAVDFVHSTYGRYLN